MDAYEALIDAELKVEALKHKEKNKVKISSDESVVSLAKQIAFIEVQMEIQKLRKELQNE
jgi:hypothetical protein